MKDEKNEIMRFKRLNHNKEGICLFFLHTLFLWIKSTALETTATTTSIITTHDNLKNINAENDAITFTSDSCDWYGSGVEDEGVVVPVYLRCSQGNIKWKYPRGGLRILFQPNPLHDFKGCIRISKKSNANVKVSSEEPGPKLNPLYHLNDGNHYDLLRCFNSSDKKAALFVEVIPTSSLIQGSLFEIDYHLSPVEESNEVISRPECRPCTNQELVHHYCSSDFLIRGSISSLINNEVLLRSDIGVKVDSLLRDSSVNNQLVIQESTDGEKRVVLHRPFNCHSKPPDPDTDFLLMGHWILGNPVITCAPKWSDWRNLRLKAIHDGSGHCRLGL